MQHLTSLLIWESQLPQRSYSCWDTWRELLGSRVLWLVCALLAQLEENCEKSMNQNQDKQITHTNNNFLGCTKCFWICSMCNQDGLTPILDEKNSSGCYLVWSPWSNSSNQLCLLRKDNWPQLLCLKQIALPWCLSAWFYQSLDSITFNDPLCSIHFIKVSIVLLFLSFLHCQEEDVPVLDHQ